MGKEQDATAPHECCATAATSSTVPKAMAQDAREMRRSHELN
jgi:hypothetical protein